VLRSYWTINTVEHVREILREYNFPLTVRQIYYRLVSKNVIPNTPSSYKMLSKALVKARERGEVDDSKIEDRSRQILGVGDYGFESIEEFINDRITLLKYSYVFYTKRLWSNQPRNVIIVLEKDALSRLFVEVADRYRVHVYPTRGYSSYSYVKDIVRHINTKDKTTIILYFGDYDPSGRDIERDLVDRLRRYGAKNFEVRRIALTREQIAQYNLPPRPEDVATIEKLKRDPRAKRYGIDYACELDALEPKTLQKIIEDAILENIDLSKWKETLRKIEEEREELRRRLERVRVLLE